MNAVGLFDTTHNAVQAKESDAAPIPVGLPDGVYRFDYNLAAGTINGSPNPLPANEPHTQTAYWAYRSACSPTACAASETAVGAHIRGRASNLQLTAHGHELLP